MKNPLMDESMVEGAEPVRLAVIATGMFELSCTPIFQAIWLVVAGYVLWKIRDFELTLELLGDGDD